MLIVDKRNIKNRVSFKDTTPGSIFTNAGKYYMRIVEESDYNAVDLNRFVLVHIDNCETVIPLKATMTVDE